MNTYIASILTVLVFLCARITSAEDSDHKKALNQISMARGLGVSHVELLQVEKGPGRAAVWSDILDTGVRNLGVKNSDIEDVDIDEAFTTATGDGWNFTIWRDGTKVEMMNFSLFEKKKSEIKQRGNRYKNRKIQRSRLEKIGMKFITKALSRRIKLNSNETLVPLHTMYEVDGDGDLEGNIHEETIGNIVVFSRTIDGVDVVGAGSKISVFFTNDETPVGFRYDWPTYKRAGMDQNIVGFEEAKERLSAFSGMKNALKSVMRKRMECGYYDPGASSRDEQAYVQSACYAFYQGKSRAGEAGESVAYSDIVPMGEFVEIDDKWGEAKKHRFKGDQCEETDVSSIILN